MKEKFHQIDIGYNSPAGLEPSLVHCTRCADEYFTHELVYGCQNGDTEYFHYCRNDFCYGRFPHDIYQVEVYSY